MNNWIEPVNVIEVVKFFCGANKGDDATTDLIISIGAELLDVSQDRIIEMMEES